MRIGIMQPYLFPYLGYFQLINAVDKYIVLDDVQYIKGGRINRNVILLDGKLYKFTFSVSKAPHNYKINQRYFSEAYERDKKKFLNVLRQSYSKAPCYKDVAKLLKSILDSKEYNAGRFITRSLRSICSYLSINTPLVNSSKITRDEALKKEHMVMDIVKRQKGSTYINAVGGTGLYSKDNFEKKGVKLCFLKMKDIKYKQFDHGFIPNLSIVDVMMFNSKKKISNMLNQFSLV